MKYINKTKIPQFFIDDTIDLNSWSEYFGDKKRVLKTYLLENEQNYLCGYCESKVTLDSSHIEHIKPKSFDVDTLTFKYTNLLVSCNGICYSSNNTPENCGHKKAEDFNEILFLDPTQLDKIRDFFKYSNDGKIDSSGLDEIKALYTINLLKLNTFNNNLQEARKKALLEFRESVIKYSNQTGREVKEIAIILLNKENLAFISFLRYQYKNILMERNNV